MIRNRIHLDYTLTFTSPFHLGTGMGRGLLDRTVARDAGGFLYIPGSTIKGILREKCEQLAGSPLFETQQAASPSSPHLDHLRSFAQTPTLVEAIFGSRFREGTVYFDNANMLEETSQKGLGKDFFTPSRLKPLQVQTRTRTSVSRLRGTVQEQALFNSEYGIRDLAFCGTIYGMVEGPELNNQISSPVVLLAAGLRLFDRIGANKSVGTGQFLFQVDDEKITIGQDEKTLHELIDLLEVESA